jgi:hypothetical protein
MIGNPISNLRRKVSIEKGKEFKEQNKLDAFFETSAKTGFNAKNVIE